MSYRAMRCSVRERRKTLLSVKMALARRSCKGRTLRQNHRSGRHSLQHHQRRCALKEEHGEQSRLGLFEPGEIINLVSSDMELDAVERVIIDASDDDVSLRRPKRFTTLEKAKAKAHQVIDSESDVDEVEPDSEPRWYPRPPLSSSWQVSLSPSNVSNATPSSSSRTTIESQSTLPSSFPVATADDEENDADSESDCEARREKSMQENQVILKSLQLSSSTLRKRRRTTNGAIAKKAERIPGSARRSLRFSIGGQTQVDDEKNSSDEEQDTPSATPGLRRSTRRRSQVRIRSPLPSPKRARRKVRDIAPLSKNFNAADVMYISDEPFDDWLEEEEEEKVDDSIFSKKIQRGSREYKQWKKALLFRQEYDVACHHCGKYAESLKMRCRKHVKGVVCQLQYCATCINEHYTQITFDLQSLDFFCPRCTGDCGCDTCTCNVDGSSVDEEEQEEEEQRPLHKQKSILALQGWGQVSSDERDDDERRFNESSSSDDNDDDNDSSIASRHDGDPMDDKDSLEVMPMPDFLDEVDWITSNCIDPRLL